MKNPLKSRKFWAWIVWGAIAIAAIIGNISGKFQMPVDQIIGWYGAITLVWIGVEGGIDAISAAKKKIEGQ